MRTRLVSLSLMAALSAAAPALSQSDDAGRDNFIANCAQCHGGDAKGDGPRSAALSKKPADLTLLAKRNNGEFNAGAIYQLIDGRTPGSRPHISAEMPIWGCRHPAPAQIRRRLPKHSRPHAQVHPPAAERSTDSTTWQSLIDLSCDSDQATRERILSIVGYLSRIQVQ